MNVATSPSPDTPDPRKAPELPREAPPEVPAPDPPREAPPPGPGPDIQLPPHVPGNPVEVPPGSPPLAGDPDVPVPVIEGEASGGGDEALERAQ